MTEHYPFSLPPLPYEYDALEPFLSEETIKFHYNLIFQTYVVRLNNLLSNYPQYQDWSLKALVVYSSSFPKLIRDQITLLSSGVYNHTEYFNGFSEKRQTRPTGNLLVEINRKYGSFENFEELVVKLATQIVGSGYLWFVFNSKMDIDLITTENQGTPPIAILNPLFNLDIWEHAYLLQYKINREQYIRAFLQVIDWDKISAKYDCPKYPCIEH